MNNLEPLDESIARSLLEKRFPDCHIWGTIHPQPDQSGNFVFEVHKDPEEWGFIPRSVIVSKDRSIRARRLFSKWPVIIVARNISKAGVGLALIAGMMYGLALAYSSLENGDWKSVFAGIGMMVVPYHLLKLLAGSDNKH